LSTTGVGARPGAAAVPGRGGGAFWTDNDVDGAFIVRFPDVEALEEAPDPLERR
jgi:hypothetical protein